MKVIQINENIFDLIFEQTLERLELISLQRSIVDTDLKNQADVKDFIHDLHRKIHYEISILKDNLKRG